VMIQRMGEGTDPAPENPGPAAKYGFPADNMASLVFR
jgi:hypothetical protein